MISDLQRLAATNLGLTNKAWYMSAEPETFIKCPACGSSVSDNAALCPNCKYVTNEEKAKLLGIKVA
jgi:uncharacterized OB-fold protein